MTLGADGLGLISYRDATNGDLKVAHCIDLLCASASTFTLDSVGDVGLYTSATVGADGLGLISYYDATNERPQGRPLHRRVLHERHLKATLATSGHVGLYTSATVGADGLGLISLSRRDERRAARSPTARNDVCANANTQHLLDNVGIVGEHASVTIGPDGLRLVSLPRLRQRRPQSRALLEQLLCALPPAPVAHG